jgi:homogentisate 1,2-dioxygenase
MAFMIETRNIIKPTRAAMTSPQLQADYYQCWQGIRKNFNPQ